MTNLLDVVITRSDVAACFVRVGLTWPDHSWIVAGLDLLMPQDHTTVVQTTRGWRSFNFDAFISDLHESTLLSEPPTDVDYLFDCYHRTLETLVDLHAPLKTVQVRADHTARWFDAECKPVKRETRKLERRHRKYGTTVNRLAWREQLSRQRKTVPEKAEGILSNANTKANWSKVKALMSPPVVANASPFSADDCAKHFVDKVAKIRASTANAPPPVITPRPVSSVTRWQRSGQVLLMRLHQSSHPDRSRRCSAASTQLQSRRLQTYLPSCLESTAVLIRRQRG